MSTVIDKWTDRQVYIMENGNKSLSEYINNNSTVLLNFKCGQYEDILEFFVVPGDVDIILGYSWLEKVDP